ncbi:enoyl-CoA hydratase/isomerase family protein [Burkholderia sp. SCN-KJ]|uniref:enoyl-CoA hydratase/isomerase family protein n=1 Tax=Burkholderia sp. SCN-KJ TaxID=2969248 RepID=UPI00215003D1|nr:enoyl-CoA hydratase/isomerase family protein [Burkholderia sp. SCN-KJ]MCR4467857.1 enoyl-CoA hydratase/isomerase family protein [Burkholderia sp. SCN-KJ]
MATTLISNASFEATIAAPGVVLIRILAEPLGVFTVAARRELTSFLETVASKHDARCVVLTGRGKGFSVGSNIKEFEATAEWIDSARVVETNLAEMIERGPVPVIAACNGHTLGGGLVMALACDFRIAGRSATFGFPEVKLGAMASSSGTQRLPLQVGRGHALKLMLTGQPIDAREAYRIGLIEELVADEELERRAIDVAREIAAVSPRAVSASRRCVSSGLRNGYYAGLVMEEEITVPLGLSDDAIEGKAAFVEKRAPRFA